MSTTATQLETGAASRPEKSLVLAGVRYDWTAAVLAAIFTAGLFLDGWAHNHGLVDESFFTPWHGVFYGGFVLYGGFLAGTLLVNRARGLELRRSLPEGYGLALLGAAIFAAGGVGDMVWHTLFGIEENVEALLSPTHLLLGLGMSLMVSGPLRAAWQRAGGEGKRLDWSAAGPALVSLAMLLSIFTFLTQYAHPVVWLVGSITGQPTAQWWLTQPLGISSILLQTSILMGFVLLAILRWRLPFGSLAFLLGANTLMMAFMEDNFFLAAAMVLAGLAGDLLYTLLRPAEGRSRLYLFAFLFPAAEYALYFTAIEVTSELAWSIHLWSGTIVLAGAVGLLLAILLAQVNPALFPGQRIQNGSMDEPDQAIR
jgi:hypothetical protein